MLTDRVKALRDHVISARPEVFAERALLVTEAYMATEGQPAATRRAAALDSVLRKGSILIRDGELIVGCKTPSPKGSPLYPEFNSKWIEDELDTLASRAETPFYVSPETKKELREKVLPYWRGRTVYDAIVEATPPRALEGVDEALFFHYYLNRSIGHLTVDYGKVLRLGMSGIRRQVSEAIGALDYGAWDVLDKKAFYEALLVVADASVAFAHRYASLAEEVAGSCRDPRRRDELLSIARVCRRVPQYPAETFHEALQSFWFVHLILNLESNSYAISPGRFCQYINPYLQDDLEKGNLDRPGAQELLNCLWVKINELTVVKESGTAKASNTYVDFQNLNIGGLRADGSDGTNDVSFMCLEALADLRLPQPQLSALISRQTGHDFLLRTAEVVRMGTGMPAVFNEDERVVSLLDKGKTLEDARTGGINGCVEPVAQGCDHMASSGYINLAKCLELALNDGVSMTTGKRLGPPTGTPSSLDDMEALWTALESQVQHVVGLKHIYDEVSRAAFARHCPVVFTSLVMEGCIKKGRDFHQGGCKYNLPMMCGVGTGTVTDAMAALQWVVFEQRRITLKELVPVLESNFQGHEEVRDLLWNRAPKFGNGIERVDLLAARLVAMFCRALSALQNQEGTPYAANMIPTTTHIPFGAGTAATPDGRLCGDPLSEGISPVQGKDTSGPTAVLRSLGRIDHARCAGTLVNMKFTPGTLKGEEGLRKFADLIRTYFDLGGHHLQFNVVSRETLLEAQKNPGAHRSLIVRVAGYSDYFASLSREVQDEIISRTGHEV
ncbi:MAG: glycyl radical protein [Bacillota bacterium]